MRARLLSVLAALAALAVVSAGCTVLGPQRSTWAFAAVQIADLAAEGLTGAGVKVAVIDTGIDLEHPNLRGVTLAYWADLVNSQPTPYDDNGHGTAMASILVGRGSLAGGSPGVSLIVIKAIASDGTGTDATIAAAINTASQQGADIISLSLGGGRVLPVIGGPATQAVDNACALGILVVASAGNDGGPSDDGQVASPGVARDAISVGAVDNSLTIASFSSVGKSVFLTGHPDRKPEVVAPGVDIAVAWLNGETALVSGTSPAAVFVSAGLALVLEKHPNLKRAGPSGVDTVKNALMSSARKLDSQASPHDDYYGYGLFQAKAMSAQLS